ncbi:MAG: glycosyltransferase [Pseudoflavonifractor sp.]|nr:glycosyltransferase [Alloprevotella sp.]MCM1116077.1 glycosyltransferase [Pseudoflavonifractor sp.]
MTLYTIIPTYNVESYIREFLDSLIKQDCPDVRYLIIDDGSTDQSGKICDEYADKDSRLQVTHIKNGGVSRARNTALEKVMEVASDDDYILFFDPDDYLNSSDAISQIEANIKSTMPDILAYNNTTNDKPIQKRVISDETYLGEKIGRELFPSIFLNQALYHGKGLGFCLFRGAFSVSLIKDNDIRFREDIRRSEDILFCAHCLSLAEKVALIDIAPYNYRVRPQSLTTSYIKPSSLGIEKGLSILKDLKQVALQCKGIDQSIVEDYFYLRHINILVNYAKGLTDPRNDDSAKEQRSQLKQAYSHSDLSEAINSQRKLRNLSQREQMELIASKKANWLWAYSKLFNGIKKIASRH